MADRSMAERIPFPTERRTRGWTRRKFLIGALATGVAGVGLYKTAEYLFQPPIEIEDPELLPSAIKEGKVRIIMASQEVKLRKDPNKLDAFEKDANGQKVNVNIISWHQIDTVNGVSVRGHNAFFVDNPEIEYGHDPSGSGKEAEWIRLRAVRRWPLLGNPLKRIEGYVYLSISDQTKNGVQTEFSTGKTYGVHKAEGDKILTDGKTFTKADVGKIMLDKAA